MLKRLRVLLCTCASRSKNLCLCVRAPSCAPISKCLYVLSNDFVHVFVFIPLRLCIKCFFVYCRVPFSEWLCVLLRTYVQVFAKIVVYPRSTVLCTLELLFLDVCVCPFALM